VVGVVNKVEMDSAQEEEEIPATYAEFKQQFRATKAHEKTIFASYSKNGVACDPATQCTTAAVFHHMDKITFELVHKSIERGLKSIQEKVQRTKEEIRERCAPPLAYYDCSHVNKGRKAFLEDVWTVLDRQVTAQIKMLHLFEHHTCDKEQTVRAQQEYLERHRIHWPAECALGDMFVSQKQSEAVDRIREALHGFVAETALPAIQRVLSDGASGCFSSVHRGFHRIDRFPKLIDALRKTMLITSHTWEVAACSTVNDYLQNFWDYKVPEGVTRDQVPAQLEKAKHVALWKMFEQLKALIKGDAFDSLLTDNSLFEEDEEFAADRERLRLRWEHLHRQEDTLKTCSNAKDNEALREALVQDDSERHGVQHTTTEEGWMGFWQEAKAEFDNGSASARVVPTATTLFPTAQSPSQMSRGAGGGGGSSQLPPASQPSSRGNSTGSPGAFGGDLAAAAGMEDGRAMSSRSIQPSQAYQAPTTTAGHADNEHGHAAADARYVMVAISKS
jgi:chaperonin cofactor prefoldin